LQCLAIRPGEIAIDHKQNQISPHGHPGCQSRSTRGIDFIDPWCIHQLNAVEVRD
jgi:hypothetical protein